MPEPKDKTPQTLDEIMAASWDETMGETDELKDEYQHLGQPNDPDEPEEESEDKDEDKTESDSDDVDTQEEPVDELTDDTEQEQEETSLVAPDHWSKEDRKMFENLNDGAKEFLLRRHKQMEGDYTRKTQENAEAVKVGKLIDEGLDPTIKADLVRLGVDNENYVRQMMNWHTMSVKDPVGFVRAMVQQLRLDPAQVFNGTGAEKPQSEEKLDPTAQRLQAIEQHLQGDQRQRMAAVVQQQQAAVQQFAEAKDDQGNLLHPHFETVRKDMAIFVRADPNMTIEDAYNVAVYRNPELRSTLKPMPQSNETSERTKKALRAKRSNVKSRGPGSVSIPKDDKPMSLQAAMMSAADEVGLK